MTTNVGNEKDKRAWAAARASPAASKAAQVSDPSPWSNQCVNRVTQGYIMYLSTRAISCINNNLFMNAARSRQRIRPA